MPGPYRPGPARPIRPTVEPKYGPEGTTIPDFGEPGLTGKKK